ncbi:MAG: monofunctional biosynthetic peptidoglycan transglycosylase [Acidobacteria bacterium]|nr:monofunctional biosynthetic peptidoglycan transglycosylase [Acidobacteriota bacterium]
MRHASTPRRPRHARLRQLAWRIVRAVGLGACVAVAVSMLAIVALRWASPPTTAFMLGHQIGAWRAGTSAAGVRYQWVDWADINPELAVAVVAAEDQRFREHHGLDFAAIRDALEERRREGRVRGASTISQQVAKNLFLWPGQSWLRKGVESYLTVLIELVWSKRRVLEVYLNVAEFGDGVYGVGAASVRFFAREPALIDREQAALLAAVLPSPKRLDVSHPSAYVRSRQSWILSQMEQLGGVSYLDDLR